MLAESNGCVISRNNTNAAISVPSASKVRAGNRTLEGMALMLPVSSWMLALPSPRLLTS